MTFAEMMVGSVACINWDCNAIHDDYWTHCVMCNSPLQDDPCDAVEGLPFHVEGKLIGWVTLASGLWAIQPIEPNWSIAKAKAENDYHLAERKKLMSKIYNDNRFPSFKGSS